MAFIRIWFVPRSHTWGNRGAAYRWRCEVCPHSTGTHHFDRFTDRIRYRPDTHPWRRCIDAVDRHICNHHRGLIRPPAARKEPV